MEPRGLPPLQTFSCEDFIFADPTGFGDGSVRFCQERSPLPSDHPISGSKGTRFQRETYFGAQTVFVIHKRSDSAFLFGLRIILKEESLMSNFGLKLFMLSQIVGQRRDSKECTER